MWSENRFMDEKREHILNTAERLFAQGGFEGTSVRKIAQESGVNIAMISYYFNSKEGLLKAIVENRIQFFTANLTPVWNADISAKEKLKGFVSQVIDLMVDYSSFTRIVNMELTVLQRPEIISIISRYIRRNYRNFCKVLEECDIDVSGGLKLLPNMVFGYTAQVVTSPYFYSLTMASDVKPENILEDPYRKELKKNIKIFIESIIRKLW